MAAKKIDNQISTNKNNIDDLYMITASLENRNTELINRIVSLEEKLKIEQKLRIQLESRIQLNERHADDLNQYSNRLSLIIENMQPRRGQSPDDMKRDIIAEIKRLKINIKDFEVDRCHRMFGPHEVNGWTYYPAIVRFTSWSARNALWTARKQCKWKLSPHLTPRREDILQQARDILPSLESLKYVFCDKNCVFQAKAVSGKLHSFSTVFELVNVAAWAATPPSTVDELDPTEDEDVNDYFAIKPVTSAPAPAKPDTTGKTPIPLMSNILANPRPANSPRRLLPNPKPSDTQWSLQQPRRSGRINSVVPSVPPISQENNFSALNNSPDTSPDGTPTKGFVVDP